MKHADVASLVAVIVNWETPAYTLRCAEALLGDGVPPERIVVVDNGSADDSAARLRAGLPRCVLIRLEQNVGFARAANAGARALHGTSYLSLNNDAFLHRPGSVRALLAALDDPRVGIAVPRLRNVDLTLQPNVVPANSPAVALVRASGLSRLIPNRWQPRWGTHWDHARARDIDAAVGAALLIRGEVWQALGGLSEERYMYADDLDLCWRTRKLGWRIRFTPEAEFVHVGNASCGQHWGSAERAEMISRSESAMIHEHLPPVQARLTLAFMAAGLAARRTIYRAAGRHAAADSLDGSLRGISWRPS
jgi:N-acetylglucosaminyl-diphospho-decaprenol L-rhamnosyltransferase